MTGTILWAIIVGIDEYPGKDHNPLGAAVDVDRIYKYLIHDRKVPQDNAKILQNKEATRQNIISTITAHFINNDNIQRGDPLVFYFSGHGSTNIAPEGWSTSVAALDIQEELPSIECIVPYDSVGDPVDETDELPGVLPGIPDRTINALFRQVARAKGDNITIILDCCHSEHASRESKNAPPSKFVPRGIKHQYVGRLCHDTDIDIWGKPEIALAITDSGTGMRGGALSTLDASHVLLAASARDQEAQGNTTYGGLFTRFLIDSLHESGGALSNKELIDKVNKRFSAFYVAIEHMYGVSYCPPRQDPQCVGTHANRPVFQSTRVQRGSFSVRLQENDMTSCQILAGETAGVTLGTMFRLINDRSDYGDVVVTNVGIGSCIAKLPAGVIVEKGMQATLEHLAKPTSIYIVNANPTSPASTQLCTLLTTRLNQCTAEAGKGIAWYTYADAANSAELILSVDEQGVELQRRDGAMENLDIRSPKMRPEHITVAFPELMRYVSLFDFYLSLQNSHHTFSSEVEVHFHYLKDPLVKYSEDDLMIPGDEIVFSSNGEVDVLYEEDALYSLVLKNNGKTPLFPYVLFFDPMTYSIQLFYEPLTRQAPLQPGRTLQLGRSPDCMAAIVFTLNEQTKKDIGFLKIILSTEEIPIKFMELDSVLGYDEINLPNLFSVRSNSATGIPQPLPGAWDTILRKVTVLPVETPA